MSETVFIILAVIVGALIVFLIPQLLMRAAVPKVIAILREHRADCAERAVAAVDVGLAQRGIFERAFRRRDYKPRALMGLIQIGVVALDDDGNIYICEEELAKTIWHKH
tara:strand:- start:1165 stop:1491 length:327 start_codon:yes stop_codon:yes gene_type:complete